MIDYIKLTLSDFLYYRTINNNLMDELSVNGFIELPSLSKDFCSSIISEIDFLEHYDNLKTQSFQSSGDTRHWIPKSYINTPNIIKLASQNHKLLPKRLRNYYAKDRLSMVNVLNQEMKKGSTGSGEGWHCDSPFSHQIKIFTFLKDVNTDNGPLRLIPKSHQKKNKYSIHKKLKKNMSSMRYDDSEIKVIEDMGFKVKELLVPKGSRFLVDTRIIHAGKAIKKDKRYAITDYYFKSNKELNNLFNRI